MSLPRLNKEKQILQKEGFNVVMQSNTLWNIQIAGPKGSPFQGRKFEVQFKFDNFPFKAPIVSLFPFNTKIYHPNINKKGNICCAKVIEICAEKWAPTKRLIKIIEKINSLLITPDLDHYPENSQAYYDVKNGTWFDKAKKITTQEVNK